MIDLFLKKKIDKDRPDYYISPSHNFTQYTKDCEEKYWSKETAFDWGQDVRGNLKEHLNTLDPADLLKIAFMTLPMIEQALERRINQITRDHLPIEEDALKAIEEYLNSDQLSIQKTLEIQSPLKHLHASITELEDRFTILEAESLDVLEQKRLELFRQGVQVKHLETEAERLVQNSELSRLQKEMGMVRQKLNSTQKEYAGENKRLTLLIKEKFLTIEEQVLAELSASLQLVRNTLKAGSLPEEVKEMSWIKELIFKRQVRGLKDIANHALVVEQSAIAPLTVGIIHYKRHREIQEALTTFVNDEAKHSATFRRFLVEKLAAKEFISDNLIQGADRFMWVARYLPSAGLFLAVIIEAIGAATLEFFAKEEYMPDRLFRSICDTISIQDERRHMDLCVAMYNELFRKGTKLEQIRNEFSLRTIMKAVYGDKTEDHPLIEAFRAFGVNSQVLYDHVAGRLSQQLARVGLYVKPERILGYIG